MSPQPYLPGLGPSSASSSAPITMDAYARLQAQTARPDTRVYLTDANLTYGYQQRFGSTLTPMVLTAAMRNADQGYMSPFVDLLDELRETDPHLHTVLAKREWGVAGAEWELRPAAVYDTGGEPEDAATVRVFCANALRAIPNLPDRIADLMGALYYGTAAVEVLWRTVGGYHWPSKLLPVHARMIHYGPDGRTYLYADAVGSGDLSRMPFGPWPGIALDSFPSGRFLVHTPRVRGGFRVREGLGRPCAWYSMFKRWVVRDAMALAEMAGRMARIGKYATGQGSLGSLRSSNEDKGVLENALQNWTSAGSLVHPDTTEVTFEKPVGGKTIHQPLYALMNAEISKAVLGGTLTTEGGANGARSLGEVHKGGEDMIRRYDAVALAETLRRCLLAPLVRYNFGENVPVPRLVFTVDTPESMDSAAARVEKLVKVGLKVGQGWARDRFGIADPQPGEDLLGAPIGTTTPSVADDYVLVDARDGSRCAPGPVRCRP